MAHSPLPQRSCRLALFAHHVLANLERAGLLSRICCFYGRGLLSAAGLPCAPGASRPSCRGASRSLSWGPPRPIRATDPTHQGDETAPTAWPCALSRWRPYAPALSLALGLVLERLLLVEGVEARLVDVRAGCLVGRLGRGGLAGWRRGASPELLSFAIIWRLASMRASCSSVSTALLPMGLPTDLPMWLAGRVLRMGPQPTISWRRLVTN